jgi:hypothetical protein
VVGRFVLRTSAYEARLPRAAVRQPTVPDAQGPSDPDAQSNYTDLIGRESYSPLIAGYIWGSAQGAMFLGRPITTEFLPVTIFSCGFLSFLAVKWLFVCWFLSDFSLFFRSVYMYFSKLELFSIFELSLNSKIIRFEYFLI